MKKAPTLLAQGLEFIKFFGSSTWARTKNLLRALLRRNNWVFSSLTPASGRLTIPRKQHGESCAVAGIEGLTLHGLRRSFKSLTE